MSRASGTTDRRVGARLPALATFAAAALLVVGIVGMGRISVVTPEWQGGSQPEPPAPPPTMDPGELPQGGVQEPPETELPEISIPWEIAMAVLLAVIIAAVVMFARRTTWTPRSRNRSSVVGGELEDLPDAADELRRGVHAASAALDRTGTTGPDAVIEAWLALEAAASSSGTPRRPSQTPTEFTERLLREHHADSGAVTLLRDLYLRARYASHPDVSSADVTSARRALTAILDTLVAPDRAGAP